MTLDNGRILVLNGGSTSLRFALHDDDPALRRRIHGKLQGLGTAEGSLALSGAPGADPIPLAARTASEAVDSLLRWLAGQEDGGVVVAVGHRVVHGLDHVEPERVTPVLLDHLRRLLTLDPEHLPGEVQFMEAVARSHPELPQVACFDTAFHRDLPPVASRLPLPRALADEHKLRRYGFHGISFTSLMEQLQARAGQAAARGRVVLAHLGGGASLAAVKEGRCLDTTMGFTPTAGLVMGTRSGSLDPGLAPWLEHLAGMRSEEFWDMVNRRSGLRGISETTGDMQSLLAAMAHDPRAAEAVDLFCYEARKHVGAFATVLGGLDTLVFSGGVGEHAPLVRARVCAGLSHLGVTIDEDRNEASAAIISRDASDVAVHVIPTDEARVIARATRALLGAAERSA